jgi:hypothetical protein
MAFATLHLQPKWFSDASPKNPKKATATLTFTGNVADAQTVTIGTEIYEFKTSGNAGTGKIKVDVSGGVTPEKASAALVAAIKDSSALVEASAAENDDENWEVTINYKSVGTAGNAITVGTTVTNASFGQGVSKLSGGQLGTPCSIRNVVVYAAPFYYWCEKEGSDHTVSWKRFTPAAY